MVVNLRPDYLVIGVAKFPRLSCDFPLFVLISFRLSQPVIFPRGSSKGVIGGSAGFHLVPELGYRVVFVRQKKTRPA